MNTVKIVENVKVREGKREKRERKRGTEKGERGKGRARERKK